MSNPGTVSQSRGLNGNQENEGGDRGFLQATITAENGLCTSTKSY